MREILADPAIRLVSLVEALSLDGYRLADLRLDLIDEWIANGLTMRRRVRLFLAWLRRAKVTGALDVDWDDRPSMRPAIDDEQRFAVLRRLPHDRDLDLLDRFTGSVLLLSGKPTTRIAARGTPASTRPQAARSRSRTARSDRAGVARPTA